MFSGLNFDVNPDVGPAGANPRVIPGEAGAPIDVDALHGNVAGPAGHAGPAGEARAAERDANIRELVSTKYHYPAFSITNSMDFAAK